MTSKENFIKQNSFGFKPEMGHVRVDKKGSMIITITAGSFLTTLEKILGDKAWETAEPYFEAIENQSEPYTFLLLNSFVAHRDKYIGIAAIPTPISAQVVGYLVISISDERCRKITSECNEEIAEGMDEAAEEVAP